MVGGETGGFSNQQQGAIANREAAGRRIKTRVRVSHFFGRAVAKYALFNSLYMVLPRRFGKEGSLVDASAELEKLEAASQQTR